MTWSIGIGSYRLKVIESVVIKRSVEMLSDIATITLPATVFNKAIEIEDKLKSGDSVRIELGYDDDNKTEFIGYLKTIKTDGGNLTLECEDGIYEFRKSVRDEEMINPDVVDILKNICTQVGGYDVSCNYSFLYDKFVINNATAYDVLKKLRDETSANIYLKDNVLHFHPQYSEIFGNAEYDFAKNIERDGTDLKYKSADERKLLVVVEGQDEKGHTIRVEKGTTGGDKKTIKLSGVTDTASLAAAADQMLQSKVYEGYEGSIQGWLLPYVDAGYKVRITDSEYEYKNGTYYVLGVETSFSKDGGKRKVTLGKKFG